MKLDTKSVRDRLKEKNWTVPDNFEYESLYTLFEAVHSCGSKLLVNFRNIQKSKLDGCKPCGIKSVAEQKIKHIGNDKEKAKIDDLLKTIGLKRKYPQLDLGLSRDPIEIECLKHGNLFPIKTTLNQIVSRGINCFICIGKAKLFGEINQNLKLNDFEIINHQYKDDDIIVITEEALIKCNKCSGSFPLTPQRALNLKSCNLCGKDRKDITTEEIKKLGEELGYIYLSDYKGMRNKDKWKCKKHNENFDMVVFNLIRMYSKPECCQDKGKNFSQEEIELREKIIKLFPEIGFKKIKKHDPNSPLSNKSFELDIYSQKLKLAIEWDGDYHHSSEEAKERDHRKEDDCLKNGITLIRINDLCLKKTAHKQRKEEVLNTIKRYISNLPKEPIIIKISHDPLDKRQTIKELTIKDY